MAEAKPAKRRTVKQTVKMQGGSTAGPTYWLGLIGAAIYFIQQASGFGEVIVALLKALAWPVFLVLELFRHVS